MLYCCGELQKYKTWWDFIKHLIDEHGYSKEAATTHAMDIIAYQVH